MPDDRASIVAYIEATAEKHRKKAAVDSVNSSWHRGTATILSAIASNIAARFDEPDETA